MDTIRQLYLRSWRGFVLAFSLTLIAYLLYFQRLGSLLPGYSTSELQALTGASNWHTIAANPVNAPYKSFDWLSTAMLHHGILANRIITAVIGLLGALLFFVVVRAWCSYRVAFFATVMFATSAGLLHFARLGTGEVLQMCILALLAVVLWYRKQRNHRMIIGYLLIAMFVVIWYIPGMFWFELFGLWPLKGTIRGQARRTNNFHLAGMLVLFLLLLAPLIIASSSNPHILLQLAGLPPHLSTLKHFGSNLLSLALAITVHSNGSSLYWVGHAPLLNAIEVVAGLLGAYYVFRQSSVRRTFLFGSMAIGLVLASLGGEVTFACLVPILYLFIAIGIDHLLSRWFTVFPRNPIARLSGVGVVCVMVTFSVFYQVRTYYVAWPHAPATRAAFDHPAP